MKIKLSGKAGLVSALIIAAAAFGLGMLFESVHTERFVVETLSGVQSEEPAEENDVPETASQEVLAESTEEAADEQVVDGKININTADIELLDKLDGIGESTAQKIIDYRNANGNFESIEELTLVSGIGEKKLDAIRDKICVE